MPIRTVLCPTGVEPFVSEIEDNLKTLQTFVGGYIEAIPLGNHLGLICNDDGVFLNLPQNRCGILGNFLVIRYDDEGNHVSLTDDDISSVLAWMNTYKDVKHVNRPMELHTFSTIEEMYEFIKRRRN